MLHHTLYKHRHTSVASPFIVHLRGAASLRGDSTAHNRRVPADRSNPGLLLTTHCAPSCIVSLPNREQPVETASVSSECDEARS